MDQHLMASTCKDNWELLTMPFVAEDVNVNFVDAHCLLVLCYHYNKHGTHISYNVSIHTHCYITK